MTVYWTLSSFLYTFVSMGFVFVLKDSTTAGTIPLFASERVFSVYCLAAIPLFVVICRRYDFQCSFPVWLGCAVAGWASILLLSTLAVMLTQNEADYLTRVLVRSALSWVIAIPIALGLANVFVLSRESKIRTSTAEILMSLLCAFGLPAVYVHVQVTRLRAGWQHPAMDSRLSSQLNGLARYWELYGDTVSEEKRLRTSLRELKRQYRELLSEVAMPLPSAPASAIVMQRAMHLLMIERPDEADKLLTTIESNDQAMLLRALAAREMKKWQQVEVFATQILQKLPGDRIASELMGEALHAQHRLEESLQVYQGLIDTPSRSSEAPLHLRLAKVFMDKGDRANAQHHLTIAVALDPDLKSEVLNYQRSILNSSCSRSSVSMLR